MTTVESVAVASGLTAVCALIWRLLWQMARIDFRVEEMWRVFISQPEDTPFRGRRRYDRTVNPLALGHTRAMPRDDAEA